MTSKHFEMTTASTRIRITVGILVVGILFLGHPVSAEPWMAAPQTIGANGDSEGRPAVAADTTHDEYLVVWTDASLGQFGISGVRVGSDGLPIGSPFMISAVSDNARTNADVAWDPLENRYLVVWQYDYSGNGADWDVEGRFIPRNGPSSSLPVFSIHNPSSSSQINPAVTYAFNPGEFLIVWTEYLPSNLSVWGRRLSYEGTFPGGAFTVVAGTDNYHQPRVAWNPISLRYLVVFTRYPWGDDSGVYGTLLYYDGVIDQALVGIADWPGNENYPDVALARSKFLVSWREGGNGDVFARAISCTGTAGPLFTLVTGATISERPTLDCSQQAAECLVTWQKEHDCKLTANLGVFGAITKMDGAPTASLQIHWTLDQLAALRPAVAFNNHGRALVTWEAQQLDTIQWNIDGRLVGNRLFADDFESGDTWYWNQ